jgi:hypothetical protein
MSKPVWDVVATVDEPGPLVLAFVAHTLSLGPRCLHLYFDRPNTAVQEALATVPNVKVTLCTETHWRESARRMRPTLHVGRQKENARQVYEGTPAEWMVSIDCDEFLSSGAELEADLAALGPEATFMRIPVKERVLPQGLVQVGIFDGVFRSPMPNYQRNGARIYGDYAGFFRLGMTGHAIGKSAFRTGRGLQMCLHAPLDAPMGAVGTRASLRHFDGLTDLHYAMKLLRRAREPVFKGKPRHGTARLNQFTIMADIARKPAMVLEMVEKVKRLTGEQIQALRELSVLDEAGFDPRPALAQFGLVADLSVAAFDAELRARDAELLRATKLAI